MPSYIDQFHLADHLNPDLLRRLHPFQFPAHAEIYAQSAEQRMLYFLVAGKIQVNYLHPNGKFSVLAFLTPLAIVGDLELFDFEATQTNVVTIEPSTLLGIAKADALQFGYDDPKFLRFIIRNLTAKLHATSLIQTRTVMPLIHQLAAYLVSQCTNSPITLESKNQLAPLLGTTPRHLNRTLKRLESEGIFKIDGSTLTVLDWDTLRHYAEGE